jgi:hypothetical protein
MYDVVWYSPERVADANRLIKRLDLAEIVSRDVPGDLVMSAPGVKIPGQATLGRAIVRNFLGASDCMKLGDGQFMESVCDITQHGDGLAGGNLKDEFLVSNEIEEAEQIAADREAAIRASRPWRFGRCAAYCWFCFWALLASTVLAIRSIPRSLRKPPVRRVRSVSELEREWGAAFSSVVSRKEK